MQIRSKLSVVSLIAVWLAPCIAMVLLAENPCWTMSPLETERIYGGGSVGGKCCDWDASCFYDENSSWCQPQWGEVDCEERTSEQEHSDVNHDAYTLPEDGEVCFFRDNQVTCKSAYYCLYNEMAMQCTTSNVEFSSETAPSFCLDTCFPM